MAGTKISMDPRFARVRYYRKRLADGDQTAGLGEAISFLMAEIQLEHCQHMRTLAHVMMLGSCVLTGFGILEIVGQAMTGQGPSYASGAVHTVWGFVMLLFYRRMDRLYRAEVREHTETIEMFRPYHEVLAVLES